MIYFILHDIKKKELALHSLVRKTDIGEKTNCETRKPNIDKTGGVNEEQ